MYDVYAHVFFGGTHLVKTFDDKEDAEYYVKWLEVEGDRYTMYELKYKGEE